MKHRHLLVYLALVFLCVWGGTSAFAEDADMNAYTKNTPIQAVIHDPTFGDYGRLIFPVDEGYMSGDTLGSLRLTWYNNIDPDLSLIHIFAPSFRKQLTAVFGYDADTAKAITKKAKPKYKTIIRDLPEFEKGDRFKMNLVNCAMIGAFILSMPKRPDVERLTVYYANAMRCV